MADLTPNSQRASLFAARRREEIRELVTRWIALPDEQVGRLAAGLRYPIPASPDDVFWLLDEVERLRAAMQHVINDSPGTPDSVKKYLVRELEGCWGEPYERAMTWNPTWKQLNEL